MVPNSLQCLVEYDSKQSRQLFVSKRSAILALTPAWNAFAPQQINWLFSCEHPERSNARNVMPHGFHRVRCKLSEPSELEMKRCVRIHLSRVSKRGEARYRLD